MLSLLAIKNDALKYGVTVNVFAYERASKWLDGLKERLVIQLKEVGK